MLKHQRVTVQVGMLFDDGKDPVASEQDVTYHTRKPYSTLEQIRDLVVNEVDDGNFVVVDSIVETATKVEPTNVPCDRCGMWSPNHQFACIRGEAEGTRFGPLEGKFRDVSELREGDIVTVDNGSPMMLIMRCYINDHAKIMACDVDDNRVDESGDHIGPYRKNFPLGMKVMVLRAKGY